MCDYCPALRLCIGSGGGAAFTFPTQGWATVTEESCEGGGWACISIHAMPYSPFIGRGAHTGLSHACFKRWRDRCLSTVSGPRLLSLSDSTTNCLLLHNPLPLSRPTACLYWLISLFFNLSIFTPVTVAPPPSSISDSSSVIPAFFFFFIPTSILLDWSHECKVGYVLYRVFVWCTFAWYSKGSRILRKDRTR